MGTCSVCNKPLKTGTIGPVCGRRSLGHSGVSVGLLSQRKSFAQQASQDKHFVCEQFAKSSSEEPQAFIESVNHILKETGHSPLNLKPEDLLGTRLKLERDRMNQNREAFEQMKRLGFNASDIQAGRPEKLYETFSPEMKENMSFDQFSDKLWSAMDFLESAKKQNLIVEDLKNGPKIQKKDEKAQAIRNKVNQAGISDSQIKKHVLHNDVEGLAKEIQRKLTKKSKVGNVISLVAPPFKTAIVMSRALFYLANKLDRQMGFKSSGGIQTLKEVWHGKLTPKKKESLQTYSRMMKMDIKRLRQELVNPHVFSSEDRKLIVKAIEEKEAWEKKRGWAKQKKNAA